MNIHILHSQLRKEEKLLFQAFDSLGTKPIRIDVRQMDFDLENPPLDADIVLNRSISNYHAMNSIHYYESFGVESINSSEVMRVCGDKFLTSLNLHSNGVPQPEVRFAQSDSKAIEMMEEMGYPVVLKPTIGSWGRMLSKINDRDSAETILEYRGRMGFHHSAHYLQDYVEKNGRDIRTFVIGDQCVAGIYRSSDHWITNTARGGSASNCPITDEIAEISLQAAKALAGEQMSAILAIDLFESSDGLMVNEVNATMEFKNSITTTGVDISQLIAEYVVERAKR